MNFAIEIGTIPFEVNHRHGYIKELCRDYMTDKPPLFSVFVTDSQIEAERAAVQNRFSYEICESTALHREIVAHMLRYEVFLMHSAVVSVDGTAYVFMAKSGVGKSTHISLWQECFGERAVVVNGDKPMFSFVGDTLYAHGSPWRGKELIGVSVSAPVGGICFLERGEKNLILPSSETDIIRKIFHQMLVPESSEEQAVLMSFVNRLIKNVPFYNLKCNMEREAALVAYEGMRGDRIE